ncbi:phage tail tape measure protein [Geovibrio ferrireducens]|uniref:phage tail tape measure protein n=1 Tax=Geovibrio ferrireducens TaxID=46201 RepID=UPI0022452099|nr:phage tail tape measure protein [Geovibrio ferrireducens]
MEKTSALSFIIGAALGSGFATTIESAKGKVKGLQSRFEELSSTKDKISSLSNIEADLNNTQSALTAAQSRVSTFSASFSTAERRISPALNAAKERVRSLAAELDNTAEPTSAMIKEFTKAQNEVTRLNKVLEAEEKVLRKAENEVKNLSDSYNRQKRVLSETREELRKANVDVNKLASEEARLTAILEKRKKRYEYSVRVDEARDANRQSRDSLKQDLIGNVAKFALLAGTANSAREIEKAKGEVASLGVSESGLTAIAKEAISFTNQFSGTSAPDFIRASYDIKSGISSLSDEGVAKFTSLSAMTAKATKSSTGTMTGLFATGYGIYRQQFEKFGKNTIKGWDTLSAEERDTKFGEYFSAGISSAVQQFKTDGNQMSAALSALGAAATSAGYSMNDQLAVLGILQTTMGGSEAATKFRAFISKAAGAGDTLGMSFTDANDQLLPVPEILKKMKERYGDTLDAIEKQEITKAFGTEEAVAMIDLLYKDVKGLETASDSLAVSMGQGAAATEKMARAAERGNEVELFKQRISNLASTIGQLFLPIINGTLDVVGSFMTVIVTATEKFPILTTVIVGAVAGLMAFTTAIYAARLAGNYIAGGYLAFAKVLALIGIRLPINRKEFVALIRVMNIANMRAKALAISSSIATAATKAWAFATRMLNLAFISTPIGWIVLGIAAIAAGAYLLIKNWDSVKTFFSGFWAWFGSAFSAGWDMLRNGITGVVDFYKNIWMSIFNFLSSFSLFESGFRLISTLGEGIKSAAFAPIEAVKGVLGKVRDFLPFSDAKEGPLSTLTLSGSRIPSTLAEGVRRADPELVNAVKNTAGKASAALGDSAQTGGGAGGAFKGGGINITIHMTVTGNADPAQASEYGETLGQKIKETLERLGNDGDRVSYA